MVSGDDINSCVTGREQSSEQPTGTATQRVGVDEDERRQQLSRAVQ